jgi:hypothetical protein
MTWYWLGEQGLSSAAMPTDIGARHFVATPGTVLNLQGSASSIFSKNLPSSGIYWQYPLCFIRYAPILGRVRVWCHVPVCVEVTTRPYWY